MEGNDDEPLSFLHIAAATANVVEYLRLNEQKNEQTERESEPGDRDEQKSEQHRAYIEQRVSDLRAFERRAAGDRPGGHKNRRA